MSDPLVKTRLLIDEGEKFVIYIDTRGNATGGIGHKITAADGTLPAGSLITQEQCDAWFENDYAAALAAAERYPWYGGLDANRQRLIVLLEFNMGPRVFAEFKGTQAAIAAGEFDEQVHSSAAAGDFATAAARLLQSAWATEVGKHRSETYARILGSGIWE